MVLSIMPELRDLVTVVGRAEPLQAFQTALEGLSSGMPL